MVKYTEKLLKKGAERKRLTKQLATLVASIAKDIAENFPPETSITLKDYPFNNHDLEVIQIESNLGERKFLGWWQDHAKPGNEEDWQPHVFIDDQEPGRRIYLHGDFETPLWVAEPRHFIEFVNHIPEITAGFEIKAEELIKDLRASFDKLKAIASTEISAENAVRVAVVRVQTPEAKTIKAHVRIKEA